jgi:hypothetical protein
MNDPITAGLNLGSKLLDVIGEGVEDKDKKNQLNKEVLEVTLDWQKTVLSTVTTPKMDAFVKFLYAFRDVILPMLRPVGSAIITGIGLYFHYKGIQIDPVTHGIIDGAFPGWMASRHVEKNKQKEIERETAKRNPGDFILDRMN